MLGMPYVSRFGSGLVRLVLAGMATGFVAVACGYQPIGMSGPPSSTRQVYVEAITNETMRPGIQGVVGAAILRQLRLHGVLRSPETGPPDLILSGGVTGYQNEAIAFDRIQDTGRRFRVRVTLLATLIGRTDGKVRFKEAVVGEAFYTTGVGAVAVGNSEDEALRFAAQDVANKLVARLLEEW
jgi:Lipopolysaccharide-assembly